MPDFPGALTSPSQTCLSTAGVTSMAVDAVMSSGGTFVTGAVWPSANLGIFVPVWVEQPVIAYQMGIIVTTQSGNVDVGIYDEAGVALVRAGATAVAAAGFQAFNITDTALSPGTYFLGMAVDNGTAAFRSQPLQANLGRAAGVQTMVAAYSTGLVTPVTYAVPTVAYLPLVTASLVATL